MEAGKKPIADIFNGNRIVEIPFFQRSYVWGEEQWERFLEDMEFVSQHNKPYFLGSIILKQQETQIERNIGDIRTLVDGQQRLTTLIIFFKTLWLIKKKNNLFESRFKLFGDNKKSALYHNHNDIESFEKISDLEDVEDIESGKDTIIGAYNFFKDNICYP